MLSIRVLFFKFIYNKLFFLRDKKVICIVVFSFTSFLFYWSTGVPVNWSSGASRRGSAGMRWGGQDTRAGREEGEEAKMRKIYIKSTRALAYVEKKQ